VSVSNPRIQIMALKKAELSDEVVLRMVEMDGTAAGERCCEVRRRIRRRAK
jgi:alpha-mannosidase